MANSESALRTKTMQRKVRCSVNGTARLCSTALIITIIAQSVLTADAIKCHQCNSHLDENCGTLRLNTEDKQVDQQYLRECELHVSDPPFCRKTVIKIETSGERRIVRSCGWINHDHVGKTNACYTADNEGFTQTICSCTEDGCNAATARYANSQLILVFVSLVSLCSFVMRHSC